MWYDCCTKSEKSKKYVFWNGPNVCYLTQKCRWYRKTKVITCGFIFPVYQIINRTFLTPIREWILLICLVSKMPWNHWCNHQDHEFFTISSRLWPEIHDLKNKNPLPICNSLPIMVKWCTNYEIYWTNRGQIKKKWFC